MRISKFIAFLLQFITIGLAAAFVLVFLKPEILESRKSVVEIRQNPAPAITAAQQQNKTDAGTSSAQLASMYSYAGAVEKAAPAVVNIYTATVTKARQSTFDDPVLRRFFGDNLPGPTEDKVETSLGSGVIFSMQGYVITSNHVIADATEIQVLLTDGRSAEAKLVGSDPDTDLAILKIDLDNLPSITIGDSRELKVGDIVLAIGNPYGVGQTVTQGIVSAKGRKRLGLNTFENYIQTDAAINPGNSGGSLINLKGEMIGINSAIFSRSGGSQGIGFAIPVNLAKKVLTEIIENGHVIRGWLGIRMEGLTPQLAKSLGLPSPLGAVVTAVFENSPAAKAGIQPGDVLLKINAQQVYDARSILDMISMQKPGSTVVIHGMRGLQPFTIQAYVGLRPTIRR